MFNTLRSMVGNFRLSVQRLWKSHQKKRCSSASSTRMKSHKSSKCQQSCSRALKVRLKLSSWSRRTSECSKLENLTSISYSSWKRPLSSKGDSDFTSSKSRQRTEWMSWPMSLCSSGAKWWMNSSKGGLRSSSREGSRSISIVYPYQNCRESPWRSSFKERTLNYPEYSRWRTPTLTLSMFHLFKWLQMFLGIIWKSWKLGTSTVLRVDFISWFLTTSTSSLITSV